jgi:hypothetical protein
MIRQLAKPVSILLTICMLLLSVPHESALAAMIGTETVLDMKRSQEARDYVDRTLAREDVQAALIGQGIDPLEAKARIDSLSDAEIISLAAQLEQLPAGGDAFVVFIVAALIVFFALLIAEALGYIDIFP